MVLSGTHVYCYKNNITLNHKKGMIRLSSSDITIFYYVSWNKMLTDKNNCPRTRRCFHEQKKKCPWTTVVRKTNVCSPWTTQPSPLSAKATRPESCYYYMKSNLITTNIILFNFIYESTEEFYN
jgi:hypothetical protein